MIEFELMAALNVYAMFINLYVHHCHHAEQAT